jgi:hypothetical protein
MPGSSIKVASLTGNAQQKGRFRKEILDDGSLLITNIPLSIP